MLSTRVAPPLAGVVLGSAENDFVIAEWQDPSVPAGPPRWITPLHLHRSDDEAWYVLEGRLCVKRGNENLELHAGSAVLLPRGTPHTYWNPASERVRYFLITTPRIHQLIQEIHAPK